MLSPGTVFAGDFRVERCLYTGGLSAIYEVTQLSSPNQQRRALKVVHGELGEDDAVRAAFLEEAKRAAKVASVHVAEVFSTGCDPETGAPFVVLELLDGEPLAQRAERGPMSPRELALFMAQLGHALAAAHDLGVVHRDLKPEGIVLAAALEPNAPYRVEVQFVGVGKIASEVRQNTTAAMSRALWMAPEQAETSPKLSPATDVFSLGLFAFWLLTGKHYWKTARDAGSAMMTLMRELLFEPIVPASARAAELGVQAALPPGFDAWFARAVAREPGARFGHAREAVDALLPLLGGRPAEPGVAALPPPGQPRGRLPPPAPPPKRPDEARGASGPAPGAASGAAPAARANRRSKRAERRSARRFLALGAAALALAGLGLGGGVLYQRHDAAERAARRDQEREAERKREAEREEERKRKQALLEWSDADCPIPVSYRDPSWGDRKAPVTIVVFLDLESPKSRKLDAAVSALMAELGKDKLRVVWKQAPAATHEKGVAAALAAQAVFRAAGSEAFVAFKTSALNEQEALYDHKFSGWASQAGVKRSADYSRLTSDAETKKKVEEDTALAQKLGARPPALYVNGVALYGTPSLEALRKLAAEQDERARAERAGGAAPDAVYVALTRAQWKPVDAAALDAPPVRDDSAVTYKVPIEGAATFGPAAAPVTAVVFADLGCPHSATLWASLRAYADKHPDKLRVVWRDIPVASLHPLSVKSAAAAYAARAAKDDAAFFKAVDALFAAQGAATPLDEARLVELAKGAGAKEAAVKDALRAEAPPRQVVEGLALADALGVSSTPQIFLNGRRRVGALSEAQLELEVNAAARRAEEVLAGGVAPGALYAELQKDAVPEALAARKVDPGPRAYGAPRKGTLYAPLLIQEFCDLESPLCAKQRPVLDKLLAERTDVELVFRHKLMEHHGSARDLANAAMRVRSDVGDEAFWTFTQRVWEKTGPSATFDPDAIRALARGSYGYTYFDSAGFDSAVSRNAFDGQIALDEARAAELGIERVPTLIVGTWLVEGPVTGSELRRLVEKALKTP